MSQEEPLSLESFLSEVKASLSDEESDTILRRINSERLIAVRVEEFIQDSPSDHIRILPDKRLIGEGEADLLLQIDDYDIRLVLIDAPDGRLSIDPERLVGILKLLEENPSTVAVLIVWTTAELLSVSMGMGDIKEASKKPAMLEKLLASARPLSVVLRDVAATQTKKWEAGWDAAVAPTSGPRDSRQLFEVAFAEAANFEKRRGYRSPMRKEAALRYSAEEEGRAIGKILDNALKGDSAESLKNQLMRLALRGSP